MIRRPPRSTRTDTLFPYTTLCRSVLMRDRSRIAAGLKGLAKGQPLLVSLFDYPGLHRWVAKTLAERPIAAVAAYSAQMAHFVPALPEGVRSEEHTSELQSLMRISYAVFCLKKKKHKKTDHTS